MGPGPRWTVALPPRGVSKESNRALGPENICEGEWRGGAKRIRVVRIDIALYDAPSYGGARYILLYPLLMPFKRILVVHSRPYDLATYTLDNPVHLDGHVDV